MLINRLQYLFVLAVVIARLSKTVAFTTVNNGLSLLSAIGNSLNIRIHKVIDQEKLELIERLLLERISLPGLLVQSRFLSNESQPTLMRNMVGTSKRD